MCVVAQGCAPEAAPRRQDGQATGEGTGVGRLLLVLHPAVRAGSHHGVRIRRRGDASRLRYFRGAQEDAPLVGVVQMRKGYHSGNVRLWCCPDHYRLHGPMMCRVVGHLAQPVLVDGTACVQYVNTVDPAHYVAGLPHAYID